MCSTCVNFPQRESVCVYVWVCVVIHVHAETLTCIMYIDVCMLCVCAVCIWVVHVHAETLTCIMYIDLLCVCVCAVCIWVVHVHAETSTCIMYIDLLCVCAVCIWVVHVQRQHLQAAGHFVEALAGLGKPRKQPCPHPYNLQLEVSHAVLSKCSHFVSQEAKGFGT